MSNTNISTEILTAPQDSSNSTQANNSASFLGDRTMLSQHTESHL